MEQLNITRLLQDIKKKVPGRDLNVKRKDQCQYLERKGKIAERVMVWVEAKNIWIHLAAADTVVQAREFFDKVDREDFLSLEKSSEWKVSPNLHFSFAQLHLIWAGTNWKTYEYFDYFSDGYRSLYGKKSRDELLELAKQWKGEGLIKPEGLEEIETEFNNRNRQSLNVVPGFLVTRQWDRDTVSELRNQGKLVEHIIDELAIPLKTWGEKL